MKESNEYNGSLGCNKNVTAKRVIEDNAISFNISAYKFQKAGPQGVACEVHVPEKEFMLKNGSEAIDEIVTKLKTYAEACYKLDGTLRSDAIATITLSSGKGGLGKLINFLSQLNPQQEQHYKEYLQKNKSKINFKADIEQALAKNKSREVLTFVEKAVTANITGNFAKALENIICGLEKVEENHKATTFDDIQKAILDIQALHGQQERANDGTELQTLNNNNNNNNKF